MKKPPVPKTVESLAWSFGSVWQAFQKLGNECHSAGTLDDRVRYSGKVFVPFTWNVSATTGAPVFS